MPKFPYSNMPFSYYKNYNKYPNFSTHYGSSFHNTQSCNNKDSLSIASINNDPKSSCESQNIKNKSNDDNLNYLFDLFGLKIFFDDILILSLLFFLYSEGVKDDMLFISLLLLLIS